MFSDSVSILITWTSSSYANYTVQMWNNKTQRWDNTYCKESIVAGFCTVAETRVLVEGLVPSSIYYFRIHVSKMVTSSSSKPMKTKKLGRLFSMHRYLTHIGSMGFLLKEKDPRKTELNSFRAPKVEDIIRKPAQSSFSFIHFVVIN